MAGDSADECAPLLRGNTGDPDAHPSGACSICSKGKPKVSSYENPSESTPLLADGASQEIRYLGDVDCPPSSSHESSSVRSSTKQGKRWIARPSSVALLGLVLTIIAVLGLGFASPTIIKQYTESASVFKATDVSVNSFTPDGVQARVQGSFVLDASRVPTKFVRDLGRFGTWLAREIKSDQTEVQVYLPEYGNILLATATIPPLRVSIRDGYTNKIDFKTDLRPGDMAGVRAVANDWLQGRLGQLRVKAVATVRLSSGVLYLGSQTVVESFVFQDQARHGFPKFNITKLDFHEVATPEHQKAMEVDVSVLVINRYPVRLTMPPMGFKISLPNCSPSDAYILVANATTDPVQIVPNKPVNISAKGLIGQLSDALTTVCPGTNFSPLDLIVENYISGQESKIYIGGGKSPSSNLPSWIEGFLRNVTVPVPFAGRALGHLVRNFSMTNVHFSLPDSLAKPNTPEAQPMVSALVKAVIGLPRGMNFSLDVSHVRSTAYIYYEGKELGFINIKKWQNSTATRIEDGQPPSAALLLQFDVKKAPLQVTDESTFLSVVQALLLERKPVRLHVKAKVDAETDTAIGKFIIREIPASSNITVKPPMSGGFSDFKATMETIEVVETTESSILLGSKLKFTNPTEYSADIPFINLRVAHNGTNVGHVTARNLSISPGLNSGIEIFALWDPLQLGGKDGIAAGQDLISRFVSGFNTSIALKPHRDMIPVLPNLGLALSSLELDIPVPKLGPPEDDGQPHFIKDATLYLWSSTAVFTLASPLSSTTLLITSIDATAFYNHSEPVGKIKYDHPFRVPPGTSQTPRLPVELDLGGAGYEAIREALGGTLKMDAVADVDVQLGNYSNTVFYKGKGIGAKIRI
ncbi:conserved hypothetical protein [Histoplasma capsulatum var. duboisii H88]|uniref:Pre-rRNA processing protein n=1 Tax=Ajellomyces capsulatus (strain H88) TaxID=544711 RepID=F0U5I7_AJEC8|nr:conserved hypothetical protein [Histoplasma capsulatum var. duboisii H88]QSS51452.1 hypothetical protein I7I53_06778 [Histoplasma capsulatum var. duboisii H88]